MRKRNVLGLVALAALGFGALRVARWCSQVVTDMLDHIQDYDKNEQR